DRRRARWTTHTQHPSGLPAAALPVSDSLSDPPVAATAAFLLGEYEGAITDSLRLGTTVAIWSQGRTRLPTRRVGPARADGCRFEDVCRLPERAHCQIPAYHS